MSAPTAPTLDDLRTIDLFDELDDDALRAAMRAYLQAAERLDDAMNLTASSDGARSVLDLADVKTLAGLAVRRRLQQLGWTPPAKPALTPLPGSDAGR